MSTGRRLIFWTILVVVTTAVTLAALELLVRVLSPQATLYPRYKYSERFSQVLYPSTEMVAALPGAWRFVYTTSEYGFRAPTMPVSNRYDRPNVLVLGDSYSFGNGVDDGEEYPAALAQLLGDQANVVNLGVPGYGLTQEIRLYYEFGVAYDPAIVVLQFTDNDPDDNFFYEVTSIEDGRFVFKADQSLSTFLKSAKNFLGDSPIQQSQLYNFVRNLAYETLRQGHVEQESDARHDPDDAQKVYNELLEVLVRDLHARGVEVVFFSVNHHLAGFPQIAAKVRALQDEGLLVYLPSEPWFEDVSDYATPEGHEWGHKGHRIVAERLAPVLDGMLKRSADRLERLSDATDDDL